MVPTSEARFTEYTNSRDSYRELVLFPIQAMANLYQLYHAVAMNRYFGKQNDPQANRWGDKARAAFRRDSLLCHQFSFEIANGKWEGMMNQKHIGYTIWNDVFLKDELPALVTVCDTIQGGYTFTSERAAVVIEAEHYYSAEGQWQVIPDMGKYRQNAWQQSTFRPIFAQMSEIFCIFAPN